MPSHTSVTDAVVVVGAAAAIYFLSGFFQKTSSPTDTGSASTNSGSGLIVPPVLGGSETDWKEYWKTWYEKQIAPVTGAVEAATDEYQKFIDSLKPNEKIFSPSPETLSQIRTAFSSNASKGLDVYLSAVPSFGSSYAAGASAAASKLAETLSPAAPSPDIQALANMAGISKNWFGFSPQGFSINDAGTLRSISYATSTKYMLNPSTGLPVMKASYVSGLYGV